MSARYAPLIALAACLGASAAVQRAIDRSPSAASAIDANDLYVSDGDTVRRVALGYQGLLADVYWMRTVQYFGDKVYHDPSVLNERGDRLRTLVPLTDITTTLDPRYVAAYRFGGFFVHDYVDRQAGFDVLEKAIANNPDNWRLYQDFGYLLWSDDRCAEAADVYARGSRVPDAPAWMATMSGTIVAQCGDIDTARQMYEYLLASATDDRVRQDAEEKLKGLRALEEAAVLRRMLEAYRARVGRNPQTLAELVATVPVPPGPVSLTVDATDSPVDPNGGAYRYDAASGAIAPDENSVTLPLKR